MKAISLASKLKTFTEHWSPRTVGTFNGHDLMVVKVQGEFVWHTHSDTDDFFLVLKGQLVIGVGVYSYGMFHVLVPAWANITDVANCGVSSGAAYQTVDTNVAGTEANLYLFQSASAP